MLPTALLILTAILAAIGLWLIVKTAIGDRARGRLRCPGCWYDMQGSPSLVCPECGHDAVDAKQLTRTRRHYLNAVVGLVMVGVAWYAMEVGYRVRVEAEPISMAAVPTTWYAAVYPTLDHAQRLALIERLKRVRGNETDVWTWQGWLLAKQAARAIERDPTGMTNRQDSFALLSVVAGRTGCGGEEVLNLLSVVRDHRRERSILVGCAATLWDHTGDWRFVSAMATQLPIEPNGVAANRLSSIAQKDYANASDEQLKLLAEQAWAAENAAYGGLVYWDRILMELVRRPAVGEPFLQRLLDQSAASNSPDLYRTLTPAAALSRIRGEPLPIRIDVKPNPIVWPSRGPPPPMRVSVSWPRNEHLPIDLIFGSNHRATYDAGFRMVLSPAGGDHRSAEVTSVNPGDLSSLGSLVSQRSILERPGLHQHVVRPNAGTYQLRIQYHDRLMIGAMKDVDGLFIFESEPVELIVE